MLKKLYWRYARDASGATAVEYALIAGILALGIVAALTSVGTNLSSLFQNVASGFH